MNPPPPPHATQAVRPPELTAIALQSGSNGNCIYIESADTAILVDAGISPRVITERLAAHGRDPSRIAALVISHDHADHVRFAGSIHRRFGAPVFITDGSLESARRKIALGAIRDIQCFRPGDGLQVGGFAIETIPTPHDGREGVAFVVERRAKRLGILTDLGHVFGGLLSVIETLDAVFLESNYDPDMLSSGPYPAVLKRRIQGAGGHLSNREAAEVLAKANPERLRWACLAHLSADNNDPDLALSTHRAVLGTRLALHLARRDRSTGALEI